MKKLLLTVFLLMLSISLFGCENTNGEIAESQIVKAKINESGAKVKSITINGNLSMNKGEEQILTATINPVGLEDTELVWFSSNNKILKVDAGKVTAVSEGSAKITAETLDGDVVGGIDIVVKEGKVEIDELTMTMDGRILKDGSKIELGVSKSAKLAFTFLPINANKDLDILVLNSDCVTVSDDYTITAKNPGKATLLIVAKNGTAKLQYEVVVK